jgi:O-antigen/teichoic acid export membrane protein
MKHQIKSLSKDAAFYGGGRALSQLLSLILAPIMTAIFSPEEYGIISLLQTAFGLMVVIALVNVSSGVFFYFYDTKDKADKKEVLSTSLFFHLIIATFFGLLAWFLAPYLSELLNLRETNGEYVDYTKYIKILSAGLFFLILNGEFKTVLRMLRRPKPFFWLTVVEIVSGLVLTILFVVILRMGIAGAFYAGILKSVLGSFIGFFMVRDQYIPKFSFVYLGLFFSYALPQFPSVFFNWGVSQSNYFFLNFYSTLTELGLYSIGLKVSSIFMLFSIAFRMAWDPFAFSIMKEDHAKESYRKFYNYYGLLFVWLAAGVALFGRPILMILTPEEYHNAYKIVAILTFAFFLQAGNNMLGIGISISKKTKFISYIQAVVFASVVMLAVLLIPRFGSIGAAYVFLLGSVIQGMLYYLIAERLYEVKYNFWKVLLCSSVIFAIVQVAFLLTADEKALIASILYACIFGLVVTFVIVFMLKRIDEQGYQTCLELCNDIVTRKGAEK